MSESSRVLGVSSVAALAALLFAAPAQADTYHVAVRSGGGVHVASPPPGGGGGGVRVGAPAQVHMGGGVRVGPPGGVRVGYPGVRVGYPAGVRGRPMVVPRHRIWTRSPYRSYRTYWDPYYYSYGYYGYGYGYEYPYACCYGAGVAVVGAAPVAGIVATREPREPTIGVGVRGSAVRAGEDHPASEGFGALLRFRSRPVEVELEVGWDHFGSDTNRDDTRVATSLYVPIVGTVLQPYLVVGAGMNFAHFNDSSDTLHQGFLAGGGGLALNLGRSLTIAADVRYMVREFFDDDAVVAKNPVTLRQDVVEKHDDAVEFRANAIVYF